MGITVFVIGLAFVPMTGLFFAILFLILRIIRFVNIMTFTVGGAVLGLLLVVPSGMTSFLGMPRYVLIAVMFLSGAMGGLTSFLVLKRLSESRIDA